jgi:hypothetical protein
MSAEAAICFAENFCCTKKLNGFLPEKPKATATDALYTKKLLPNGGDMKNCNIGCPFVRGSTAFNQITAKIEPAFFCEKNKEPLICHFDKNRLVIRIFRSPVKNRGAAEMKELL